MTTWPPPLPVLPPSRQPSQFWTFACPVRDISQTSPFARFPRLPFLVNRVLRLPRAKRQVRTEAERSLSVQWLFKPIWHQLPSFSLNSILSYLGRAFPRPTQAYQRGYHMARANDWFRSGHVTYTGQWQYHSCLGQ